MIELSVIVPAYNVKNYLRQCVDSILVQTYRNFECIIIDDGSNDGTSEIIDEYVTKDNRVVVIHNDHRGVAYARNAGLQYAQGEYITFVDSDDDILPYMFEKMINCMKKYDADVAECGLNFVIKEKGEVIHYACSDNIEVLTGKDILIRYSDKGWLVHFGLWDKVYKRELFCNETFPINRVHEDEYVLYKVLYKANVAVMVKDCMYNYYKRNGSIMNVYTENRIKSYIDFSLKRLNFFKTKEQEIYNTMLKVFYVTVFENYMSCKQANMNKRYIKILILMAKKYYKDLLKICDLTLYSKVKVRFRIICMMFNLNVNINKFYNQ